MAPLQSAVSARWEPYATRRQTDALLVRVSYTILDASEACRPGFSTQGSEQTVLYMLILQSAGDQAFLT